MNFRPELAAKVMAGSKTVTRRPMSDNPRSPWYRGGCSLWPERPYAVCPGRGKHAIGRVEVLSIAAVRLGDVDDAEAVREGFAHRAEFTEAWRSINGSWGPGEIVWRVEFTVSEAQVTL